MAFARTCVLTWCLAGLVATPGFTASRIAKINQNSFTVLATEAQWLPRVDDIAARLNHQNGLHILPVKGDGCIQGSADLLNLDQIDMAVLTVDCATYAESQGLLPNATRKLAYVSRLKALPIVIVTRRDIANLTSLAGLRIATGPVQSSGFATGELLLGSVGLPFTRVPKSGTDAVEALKSGNADAALLVGLDALDGTLDPGKFQVIGLTSPLRMEDVYAPALLSPPDLKGLLPEGRTLETVSTALALAILNWPANTPQSQKMQVFAKEFFATAANSETPEALSANIPNWQRHFTSVRALEALDGSNNTSDVQQGERP